MDFFSRSWKRISNKWVKKTLKNSVPMKTCSEAEEYGYLRLNCFSINGAAGVWFIYVVLMSSTIALMLLICMWNR